MPRHRFRPIKIEWRKSSEVWGRAFADDWRIVLDHPMTDKKLLEIAAHETAHVVLPVLDEAAVKTLGKHVADVLFRLGFRRIEEADE